MIKKLFLKVSQNKYVNLVTNFPSTLQSSIRNIAQHSLALQLGKTSALNLVARALTIITAPVTFWVMTPQQYGITSLMTACIHGGTTLFGLGLRQQITARFARTAHRNRPILLYQACCWFAIVSGIPLVLICLGAPFIARYCFFDTQFAPAVLLIVCMIICSCITDILTPALLFSAQNVRLSTFHLYSSLILSLSKLLFFAMGLQIYATLWAHILYTLPLLYVTAPVLRNICTQASSTKRISHNTHLLGAGILSMPVGCLPWIMSIISRWMLTAYASAHAAGIFACADLFGQLFYQLLMYPVQLGLLPHIMTGMTNYHAKAGSLFRTCVTASSFGFLVLICGCTMSFAIFRPLLLRYMPDSFTPALPYIVPLLCANMLLVHTLISTTWWYHHQMIRPLLLSLTIPIALLVMGNWVLIPGHECTGCMISTVAATAAYAICCAFWSIYHSWYHPENRSSSENDQPAIFATQSLE